LKQEVLIIGPAHPLRGGIANFNEALCNSYTAAGIPCAIVSFSLQYPGFLFPGKTQLAGSDEKPEGITVFPMINSLNPFTWFKAAKFIRKRKPAYILIRYWLPFMAPCLGSIARLIKSGSYKPAVIGICDNVIPHEKRAGDSILTKYFLGGCDGFLVMSDSVKSDLLSFDINKPVLLHPHPVYDIFGAPVSKDIARQKLELQKDGAYILFFGFIRNYKGLDLLLQAMTDEKIRSKNIKLIVAGEFYENKQPYLNLIKNNGLEDSVILHDRYIPKEQVKYYFGAVDLVVQPYKDATQSGVTQIAYHFNKPMVVTNVGGLPEMVPHGVAGYVTEVSPVAVAAAIVDFYESNNEAQLIEGVKQTAKIFSWDKMVEKIEGLVKSGGW
jgi:D-inositol-3-phosphate glycosyltransferase